MRRWNRTSMRHCVQACQECLGAERSSAATHLVSPECGREPDEDLEEEQPRRTARVPECPGKRLIRRFGQSQSEQAGRRAPVEASSSWEEREVAATSQGFAAPCRAPKRCR